MPYYIDKHRTLPSLLAWGGGTAHTHSGLSQIEKERVMSVGDTSSDYHSLMSTIENRMSSVSSSSSTKPANPSVLATPMAPATAVKLSVFSAARDGINATTASKRKRMSDLLSVELGEDDIFLPNAGRHGSRSSSATLKLQAQVDEYKLLNEQLKEQLRSYKDEHDLFKEQSIRQLKFLEDSNTRYKSQYESTNTKYFKEKKEWQAKVRELEHSLEQQQKVGTTNSSSISGRLSFGESSATRQFDEEMQQQNAELTERFLKKQKEASALLSEKAELEKRVFQLEQQSKTMISLSHGCEDDAVEMRALRKKCNELETLLRRKSKEYDRFDQKLKNQLVLEEELAAAQQRLSIALSSAQSLQQFEAMAAKLSDEKRQWAQLFADMLNADASLSADASVVSADDCLAPRVLAFLSDLQKKHILLTQHHSDLELTLVQLRRQVLKLEAQTSELSTERASLKETIEQQESRFSALQKKSKCFDAEIQSLRALLKTFDVEFSIGKPDGAKMLASKDQLIDELRSQLDHNRKTVLEYSEQLALQQAELDKAKQAPADINIAEQVPKERFDTLEEDFRALQEIAGLDFLPHKTKVLHLKENPSSFLSTGASGEQLSSLPQDVLKRLKGQVTSLQSQLQSAAQSAAATASSSASSSDVSMMFDAQHNNSVLGRSTLGGGVDPNKMYVRLKELFKDKISTLREAVYLLTGFKVELFAEDPGNPNSMQRIRLRSMFAESPDDCLIFQLRDNSPELLESQFANSIDPSLMLYLTNYNSVPAFLAATTMHLFESQTMM